MESVNPPCIAARAEALKMTCSSFWWVTLKYFRFYLMDFYLHIIAIQLRICQDVQNLTMPKDSNYILRLPLFYRNFHAGLSENQYSNRE